MPEIYTVQWFLNLFSMVFETEIVKRIWDFFLCNPNFIICFAVGIMIELKESLLMKDQH